MDGGGEGLALFVAVQRGEGVVKLDVGVVRVVERRDFVLAVVKVHWDFEADVLEELAQFEVGADVERRHGLEGVTGDTAVQGTETGGAIGAVETYATQVGQCCLETSSGGNATFAAQVGETKLIDPHHGALWQSVVGISEVLAFRVTDTDHHGFHIADARVTDNLDGMVVVAIVDGVFLDHFLGVDVVEPDVAVGHVHGFVASLFHRDEIFQRDVQIVDFRPDELFVGIGRAPWCDLQRYLVFVVVLCEVGTDAQEDSEVLVFERAVLQGGLGVDEHLQVFVLP